MNWLSAEGARHSVESNFVFDRERIPYPFRAFSASVTEGPLPGALPQAFTFRALGAATSHFAPLALQPHIAPLALKHYGFTSTTRFNCCVFVPRFNSRPSGLKVMTIPPNASGLKLLLSIGIKTNGR